MRDVEPAFAKGSRYRIMSKGPRDEFLITAGRFVGYRAFGNGNAVAIEMDSGDGDGTGSLRIIPLQAIFAIDVIESREEQQEESEATQIYFG